MLYANTQDSEKIIDKLADVLKYANNAKTEHIFFNLKDFYRACHLSKLPRVKFLNEIEDTLTATSLVEEFGLWVIAEYGDGFHVLCKVPREIEFEYDFGNPANSRAAA